MSAPVRAGDGQTVATPQVQADQNQGSYPAEITRDQLDWLRQQADERRREWIAHAESVAHNHKS
jgi:hypothetical protein